MLDGIVSRLYRFLILEVLQFSKDILAYTHGVQVTRTEVGRELAIIREAFIGIQEIESSLDGSEIVIVVNVILERRKGLVERVGRDLANRTAYDIRNRETDDSCQFVYSDTTNLIVVIDTHQEGICNLHAKATNLRPEGLEDSLLFG